MNFKRYFLAFLALLALQIQAPAQFMNWSYVNVLDNFKESGANPDMAIDNSGGIHISAWDANLDKLIYLYRATPGSSWLKEYVNPNAANGYKSSIYLKNGSQPHIAYFENVNGVAEIRYSVQVSANNWSSESIPNTPLRGWGQYGPAAPMNATEKINHSIDLLVEPTGEPMILFFDGYWETPLTPPNCNPNGYYGLKMMQAKKIAGNWFVKATGLIPDDFTSCSGDSLPLGDRFGEYCTLIKRPNGKFAGISTTRFNNDIVHFETDVNDTTWNWDVFATGDNLIGFPVLADPVGGWATIYFTLEGLSTTATQNGNIYSTYTSSFLYGENFCCVQWYCALGFSKMDSANNVTNYSFGTSTYRNHTAIAANGNDSIYFIYSDLTLNKILMKESVDGGLSWSDDTLLNWASTSDMKLNIWNDSVYAVIYNARNEQMLLGARSLDPSGTWSFSEITKSENHGQSLDAYVTQSALDTVAHLAYNDNYTDKLFFNTGSSSGGWVFSEEQMDVNGNTFSAVSAAAGPGNEPIVLYSEGPTGHLKIAIKNGAVWNYEIIDSAALTGFTDLAIGNNDTIYAVYYAADSQALKYARRSFSGGTWMVEYIDSSVKGVGQYPSLAIDASGSLHVSYYKQIEQELDYAQRPSTGTIWTLDSLYSNLPSAAGKYSSLETTPAGLPKIAFLDEMSSSVKLLEKTSGGTWTLVTIDSTHSPSNGKPIELEIDNFGNPWLAWNHFSNFDLVSLTHRDTSWHPVSVNPTGRIASEFVLVVEGNDLFIIGKKTEPGNTGLAMLYASNGVFISRDEALYESNAALNASPNPTTGEVTFSLFIPKAAMHSLSLFDVRGHKVATVFETKILNEGESFIHFDGAFLPSGVYFYRLEGESPAGAGKLVIMR